MQVALYASTLSLTPRFSGVWGTSRESEPFQRFGRPPLKPLKRFSFPSIANSQLKLGVDEKRSSSKALDRLAFGLQASACLRFAPPSKLKLELQTLAKSTPTRFKLGVNETGQPAQATI
jgi:hypothetical protein